MKKIAQFEDPSDKLPDRSILQENITSAQFKFRARAFNMLPQEITKELENPSLVSSVHGKIDHLLLTITNRVFERESSEKTWSRAYADVYKDILQNMPNHTNFIILINSDSRGSLDNWINDFNINDRTTVVEPSSELDFTIWAEDAYSTVKDLADEETYLVEPMSFTRYADHLIADELAPKTFLETKLAPLVFQGGNILIGDDFWFIGSDYPLRSLGSGLIKPLQGEADAEAVSRVYGNALDKTKKLIQISSRKAIPLEKRHTISIEGEIWTEVFHYGHLEPTVQPIFHIDMFITLVGNINGQYTILVGDPRMAANILGENDHAESLSYAFDDIAFQLKVLGFNVIRNPMPFTFVDYTDDKERVWYYATSNNALVENDDYSNKVWLPTYGYGGWSDLYKTDEKNREIWDSLGYTIHQLPNFHPFAARKGAAHCITKYLKRSS